MVNYVCNLSIQFTKNYREQYITLQMVVSIMRRIQNSIWKIIIKSSKQIREIKIVSILCLFGKQPSLKSIARSVSSQILFVWNIRNHCMHSSLTTYSITCQGVVSKKKKKRNGALRIQHMFHGFRLPFVLPSCLTFRRFNPCHFFSKKYITRQRNFPISR